jgi:hypothetical protein
MFNSSHFLPGSNTFKYKLPFPQKFVNAKCSLSSLSMYNQTFNITADANNNSFSIIWLGTVYNFIIDDGCYDTTNINEFLSFACLNSGLYVNVTAGTKVTPKYFIDINANIVRYAGQINVLPIPTQAEATQLNYSLPVNADWDWPTTAETPQIILCPGLGKILGFKSNLTLPPTIQNDNYQVISDVTPTLSPVDAYIITCNLINSRLSAYPDVLDQVPLSGAEFGKQLSVKNTMLTQLDIYPGTYNEVVLRFFDQNYNILRIRDNVVGIVLIIDY